MSDDESTGDTVSALGVSLPWPAQSLENSGLGVWGELLMPHLLSGKARRGASDFPESQDHLGFWFKMQVLI